jgi:DsbC/DsbD-like thiol-disulfide interchange protein
MPIAASAGASLVAGLALAATVASAPASAADSPWINESYSRVRLVSGGVGDQGETLAGVQIRLEPGWRTYWRNPGDSGVPPRFDWSQSKNLKSARVLYPVPRRFAEAGGTAIGYEDEIVFPVEVTPERPGEPVELKLNVEYGLCKTLCIPNEASLSLDLPPPNASAHGEDVLLGRFTGLVPKPAQSGALPALAGAEAKLDGASPELLIDAVFPPNATGTDLFIDAGDVYVPIPKPSGPLEGGKQRFVVSFASPAEAAAVKGKPLTLTLVWDGGGRETSWTAE